MRQEFDNLNVESTRLAPQFDQRIARHKELKARSRANNDWSEFTRVGWHYRSGCYQHPFFGTADSIFRREDQITPEFTGTECVLQRLLDQALARNQSLKNIKPVICLDFGGAQGESIKRLARVNEKNISLGKLIFIVTNFGYVPSENDTHGVIFTAADCEELVSLSIPTKNGEIPLRGNVSLIHEMYTLIHGYVNDRDISILGQLLAPHGSLMVIQTIAQHFQDMSKDGYLYTHLRSSRIEAHKQGLQNLKNIGLEEIHIPNCAYHLFTNPGDFSDEDLGMKSPSYNIDIPNYV